MTAEKGYFGQFGGSFVPKPIQALLDELEATFEQYRQDPDFIKELRFYLEDYSGRPTPLYYAESLSKYLGGARFTSKKTSTIWAPISSTMSWGKFS